MLLEFHLPSPRCNPQLELLLRTLETQRKPFFDARRTHTCRNLENAVPHVTWPSWSSMWSTFCAFFLENLAHRRQLPLEEETEAPYRPIQDVPVPSLTKPTFTTRHTHANEGILNQVTSELVVMHIGQNTHKSATMLVDSGALHILVRQEHAHVLTDVTMSPNGHAFASIKSAKKGSEWTLGNWKRRLTNRTLLPTGVHIQQRRVN